MRFRQEVENSTAVPNRVTLKALANVSPGFALKPWVQKMLWKRFRNRDGIARLRVDFL
jgi:hypothetical protein